MKIQKVFSLLIYVTVLTVSMAPAEIIPGLFNTGVDNNGERLPYSSLEQHYTLRGTASTAYVFYDGAPICDPGAWVSPSSDAMWIGPNGGDNLDGLVGEYIYTLTFDLTGLDSTKTWISGQWTSDNESIIFLNGITTEFTIDESASRYCFHSLYDFTISEGFLPGVNTIEFRVTNHPADVYYNNPTGLLVQNLHGEVVPEPATLLLLGLGGLALRRK